MPIFKKDKPQEQMPSEISELRTSILNANLPEYADRIAFKELERLGRVNSSSSEYTIGMNYIDYILSLPWHTTTDDNLDIERAIKVLNEEHFGLEEIKERILEHLAVRILKLSRQYRILVVDDEELTRMNLEHVFTKDGYLVQSAASGAEALSLLETNHFDVVVTDLKMKQVDGLNVLEKAKEKDPSTAVIIITGYATVSIAIAAMKKGSYHFIAKPFKLEEIRSAIQNALASKKNQLEPKGPILCFMGPPGTGKTSLGKCIAHSLERKFIRMSMAGLKDEAELRGHRRSYVGALPGRIIQEIRRAGSRNPVLMLDEIDKIGQDFKGDPSSALLEILDPEQNSAYMDHYLDMPFDLSKVMFIATANLIDPIPRPLLDRLEVINLSGYTTEEKEQIAVKYLIPKVINESGLAQNTFSIEKDAILKVIREYTFEAGLRNLQRQLAAICRKQARLILEKPYYNQKIQISCDDVEQFLGPPKYQFELTDAKDRVGVTTGLAWTEAGGQIIFIEATKMKGNGQLILTGSLGDVMKESAHAALSFIRSHIYTFKINDLFFAEHDLHIHIPAGATPKDGPSAGISIALALISLITDRPAKRSTALTGELTLSGRILPVGGIKEKLMAAKRAGVKTVIFPQKNNSNVNEIHDDIKRDMTIVLVDEVNQAIEHTLL